MPARQQRLEHGAEFQVGHAVTGLGRRVVDDADELLTPAVEALEAQQQGEKNPLGEQLDRRVPLELAGQNVVVVAADIFEDEAGVIVEQPPFPIRQHHRDHGPAGMGAAAA